MPPGQHWPEAVGSTLTLEVGAGGAELGELRTVGARVVGAGAA
jgi:hypothetical protein